MRLGHKTIDIICLIFLSTCVQIVPKVTYFESFYFIQERPTRTLRHVTPNTIFGGDCKEVTPVPIPNTEVKLFSADGTAWETVWESRTPPDYLSKARIIYHKRSGLFLFTNATAKCFIS